MLSFHFEPFYFPGLAVVPLQTTVESQYVRVSIYPVFYKHFIIEWSVPAKWGAVKFNVYKSNMESPNSFEKINPVPILGNFYKDPTTMDFSKFKDSYYKVEVTLPDGRSIVSRTYTWENVRTNFVEIRAVEIRRRESLLLDKFTGISTLVFRRKTFGKRCTECWDTRTERCIKDNCQTCLGTSFEGGYFEGFPTKVQYNPTPNDAVLGYQGVVEANEIPAWTIDKPTINVFDLVLRVPDSKLYRASQVQSTELQTITVRQMLTLTEMGKDSVEYQLAYRLLPTEYQT